MMKKTVALLLCLFLVLPFAACSSANGGTDRESAGNGGKIRVSVTFNAMKEFTQAVGKDKVEVTAIIPDGAEPHDFEPKAKDLAGLSSARVFVYNGSGMESWAEKAVKAVGNKNLIAVDASKGIEPIQSGETGENGQYDPHVWLSPKGAETEAQNIRDALVRADPSSAEAFRQNCAAFVSQMESLHSEYVVKFQSAKSESFVTGHAAFAYLCRDFGLKQNSVEDVFAEGEPSAQKLAELVNYCKKNGVKTIFVEDMVSPEVSRTLASQVGAKVETIYTMESSENGKSYADRMKADLGEICASLNG